MIESREFRLAERRMAQYEHDAEEIIRESQLAQDCMDCEAFLRAGIGACDWLRRHEQGFREAVAEGLEKEADVAEVEKMIESLYRRWQAPCDKARKWIERARVNGFSIANLAEFEECCRHVEDWIDSNDEYRRAKALRDEAFAKEPW